MSFVEIMKVGGLYTALGMGTVFAILIFISICIWLLGLLCRERKPAVAAEPAPAIQPQEIADDPAAIDPEIIAVITAAIHQHLKDEQVDGDEYIVRKVRRATWKHTS